MELTCLGMGVGMGVGHGYGHGRWLKLTGEETNRPVRGGMGIRCARVRCHIFTAERGEDELVAEVGDLVRECSWAHDRLL